MAEQNQDGEYGEESVDAERDMIRENASAHEELANQRMGGMGGIAASMAK